MLSGIALVIGPAIIAFYGVVAASPNQESGRHGCQRRRSYRGLVSRVGFAGRDRRNARGWRWASHPGVNDVGPRSARAVSRPVCARQRPHLMAKITPKRVLGRVSLNAPPLPQFTPFGRMSLLDDRVREVMETTR